MEQLFGSFTNPKFQKRVCIRDATSGLVLTYQDMNEKTAEAAGILRDFHVRKGDVVSIMLENGAHFFMPWLGAMRIGAVAHPINCLYPAEQALYALELCQSKLLVLQERYAWDYAKERPSELLQQIYKHFPQIYVLVMYDPKNSLNSDSRPFSEKEKGAGFCGSYSWKTIQKFTKPYYPILHRNPEDPFQLICTSGTTGKPKAVVQHCGMFEPNVRDLIEVYKLTDKDRTLLINRLFHVNAQVTNFFPTALLGGETVIALPDPDKFLENLRKYKITYSSVVPSTLKNVLKDLKGRGFKNKRWKYLRFLIVGADILPKELHREFMEKTGIRVRSGWGMTETLCWGSGTSVSDPIMFGSIGTPLPQTEMKVVDPEKNWEEVARGEFGRLIVRGENIFNGYLNNQDATTKAFAPSERWGDGWFDTGDTCYKNGIGTYYFVGRASADSWKVRGEFVNGPEIDHFLETFSEVDQTMSVPIEIDGETETVICVVLRTGENDTRKRQLAEKILERCEAERKNGAMAKHCKIAGLFFVEKIELGDTGKKSRKKMTELAKKSVAGRAPEGWSEYFIKAIDSK